MTRPDLSGKRIWVIDDSRVMRMLLRNWLERLGAAVDEAEDGLEALSVWSAGGFDALLLDINMPHTSGLSVLKRVREKDTTLPVVLVTTIGQKADLERGMDLGASATLTKPLDHGLLIKVLAQLHFTR